MKMTAAWLTCLLLAACETAPAGFTPAPFDDATKPAIQIDVAEVNIIDAYPSSTTPPHVDGNFPTPPAAALKSWGQQRLHAAGHTGNFEMTIDDASVTEVKLPHQDGIKGFFTDEQDTRYDLHSHVTLKLFNGTDIMSVASADITVSRSKTINEDATVDDRTRLFDQMTRDMLSEFDAQVSVRLNQYFKPYLR